MQGPPQVPEPRLLFPDLALGSQVVTVFQIPLRLVRIKSQAVLFKESYYFSNAQNQTCLTASTTHRETTRPEGSSRLVLPARAELAKARTKPTAADDSQVLPGPRSKETKSAHLLFHCIVPLFNSNNAAVPSLLTPTIRGTETHTSHPRAGEWTRFDD